MNTLILDVIDKQTSKEEALDNLIELKNLTNTAGGIVIKKIIQKRGRPSAKTYVGTGKADEASEIAKELKVDVIICNTILKPNQIMHLKDIFKKDIWDRVDLILNIFDKHAKTNEAFLQIKLAKLRHEFPKLYARQATTLFERAGAGIGTRGAGEKGIEAEKRHLRKQINELEKKIEKYSSTRNNQRKKRKRDGIITIAIVGYTNAGKSTLLKALTGKKTYIADELFATLDNKVGSVWIPDLNQKVVIADTIGFIRDLPPFLISSFKSTLEEVIEADFVLHVVDSSDSKINEKIDVVNEIIQDLGIENQQQIPVLNKCDLIKTSKLELPASDVFNDPVFISSIKKEGLKRLKDKIRGKIEDRN